MQKKAKTLFSKNDGGTKMTSEKNLPELGTLGLYLKQILTVQTGTPCNAPEGYARCGELRTITRLTFHWEDSLSPKSPNTVPGALG